LQRVFHGIRFKVNKWDLGCRETTFSFSRSFEKRTILFLLFLMLLATTHKYTGCHSLFLIIDKKINKRKEVDIQSNFSSMVNYVPPVE